MADEPTPTTEPTEPPTPTAPESTASWRDTLPEPLKASKTLARYADVGALAQAYVNLEQLQGKALKVPGEGATAEERARFRRAVGVPETAEGYDFGKVEVAGVELPAEAVGYFKAAFHKHGVPPEAAKGILTEYVGWMERMKAAQADAYDSAMETYRKEAGEARYTREMANAHTFVKEYFDEATIADLHRLGLDFHPGLFKGLAKAGAQLAEAEYIVGDVPGQPSKDEAQAEWDRLGRDPKFLAGDPTTVARRDDLARRIWGTKEVG